jgi:hypothetical protein
LRKKEREGEERNENAILRLPNDNFNRTSRLMPFSITQGIRSIRVTMTIKVLRSTHHIPNLQVTSGGTANSIKTQMPNSRSKTQKGFYGRCRGAVVGVPLFLL